MLGSNRVPRNRADATTFAKQTPSMRLTFLSMLYAIFPLLYNKSQSILRGVLLMAVTVRLLVLHP